MAGGKPPSDEDVEPGSQGPTYEDIKVNYHSENQLAKWFMEPWFEELIIGCFVRVGIGRSKCRARVQALAWSGMLMLLNLTSHD
ncbi:hypothetical protein NC653_010076 [Populus alba x Populus x berolinensis]|uniref:Plus3 domain-containing protein n=1 Tax=Populus alba x Populus x berolinensis TaxID=444605 RepID=A0AAD6QYY0_9ROSI|nr:hypothetical protein NC653_010076 [Populus alba x Populus x berolinensis]